MNLEKYAYDDARSQGERSVKKTDFNDVLDKYIFHWPVFILCTLITLSTAFLYMHYKTPGYTIKARLMIKDDEKGTGAEAALPEINLFKTRTLVENELEVLRSRELMKQVVMDLELYTRYLVREGIKSKDLYTKSPLHFISLNAAGPKAGMRINVIIRDENSFYLGDGKGKSPYSFQSTLKNAAGRWKLKPGPEINAYIGRQINIVVSRPEETIEALSAGLSAELANKKSTVVELAVKDQVPERGRDVLNELITIYNHSAIDEKNRVRQSTLDFVDKRLHSLSGDLSAVEKNVESFKSSRGLTDISSESKLFLENVRDNDVNLNKVNVQMEVVSGIERYINSSENAENAPATTGIEDPGLITLVNQLISLQTQKEQLLTTTGAGNPLFESLNRQIASTKNAIRQNISGIKSSLEGSQKKLMLFNSGFENSIKKLPGQEREFLTIKRQQAVKEDLYVYLLQKREEAAVSYAATIADSRTVDQAYYGQPDTPKGTIIYGMALFSGLAIPFALIYGKRLFNTRVSNTDEIQELTAVPIVGELAYQKSGNSLVVRDKNRKMIAEQFRALRTNLQYVYPHKEEGMVTMITSGMPGEGKSFITCNLGAVLANAGKKTVILELDMRNPMICKNLNLGPAAGISDFVNSKNLLIHDIVRPTGINDNLYMIGAGKKVEFPAELLEHPKMEQMMDWLKQNFDEILIDTPPIQLVADAMILSKYSDANLYVVREGITYKSQLNYIRQAAQEQKLNKLNIVYNGINTVSPGKKYQYGYYLNEELTGFEVFEAGLRSFFQRFKLI